jgi:hypothetical protein
MDGAGRAGYERRKSGGRPGVIRASQERVIAMTVQSVIKAEYLPHDEEPFMCDRQKEWFKNRLQQMSRRSSTRAARRRADAGERGHIPTRRPRLDERLGARATHPRRRQLISKIDSRIPIDKASTLLEEPPRFREA